jgi:hypothetical protein
MARVRNWSNTIGGQQRAKVQARNDRLAKKENELEALDKVFADEETRRRKAAVERARKILFFQGDRQRSFHRQLLLSEVLKVPANALTKLKGSGANYSNLPLYACPSIGARSSVGAQESSKG